jgi:hypothetical protein
MRPKRIEAFHKSYTVDDNGCWNWSKSRWPNGGYGVFYYDGGNRAHRASWVIHNGPIPDGMVVCHTCDNPPCVNPAHLFVGTQADNVRDRHKKGRTVISPKFSQVKLRGEEHVCAKLSDDKVRMIRSSTLSNQEFAALFGVTPQTIHAVRAGKTWKHVA